MVDEQELHHVALRLERLVAARAYLHAFHHRGGARRCGLAHLLDVHQAHAAIGRDRQLVVVAETRNRDTSLVGGMDDHRALGRGHRDAVDLDRYVVWWHVRICRLRAHAATFAATTVPARWSSTRKRLFTIAYSNSSQ